MKKSNRFSQHFKNKPEPELQAILISQQYVYEAKQAAFWELERRNLAPVTKLKKPIIRPEQPRYQMSKSEKSDAKWQMISMGVIIISIGIYFNYDALLVTESSLIPIKGKIEYSKTFVERISSTGRFGSEHFSNKATLEIKLFEHPSTFHMFENIEQNMYHQYYESLSRELTEETPVTIWVSKNKMRYGPDFFKLDIRDKTEIDMAYTSYKSRFGFFLLLTIGTLIIYLGTRTNWTEKVRGVFRS
ncbi:hypothetical protein [Algivirga pacifica]|uniref:DUF3592 domain-containing protein n=1 Tax=Algivirga pacifica TaxID=1162670 RepID=A0ABP9DDV6_9BACT